MEGGGGGGTGGEGVLTPGGAKSTLKFTGQGFSGFLNSAAFAGAGHHSRENAPMQLCPKRKRPLAPPPAWVFPGLGTREGWSVRRL